MSGAIPLLLLYAFIAWRGRNETGNMKQGGGRDKKNKFGNLSEKHTIPVTSCLDVGAVHSACLDPVARRLVVL
jgi:hypothetical protein